MSVRRVISGAVVAAMTAGLLTLTAGSASALTSAESKFVQLINQERAKVGRGSLKVATDLVSNARRHSAEMAAKGEIYHNDNLAKQIDNWFVLGENVGVGPDVDSLHKAFMNSPHHKDNILYRDYNIVGIGIAKGDDGYMYVTEVFAGRRYSSTSTKTTTSSSSTRNVTTTTSAASAAPRSDTSAPVQRPVVRRSVSKPAPTTVDLLARMQGLDAASVNPATGAATGS
jgi:hypothetical protein